MKTISKLTLVGAGPGDPELITLKGVNALASADALLYDALVNPAILKYAPADIPRIYVGKRKGNHAYTQEQINALIVECALTYGHVVRLKGGDPFVFGRGHEEMEYAEKFNVETSYIPGISSSIGVPGMTGIPVTNRGSSESFWVITGTTQSGELSDDVKTAAQTDATIVILMGLNKLQQIAGVFQSAGRRDMPIAIIQNGSLPEEKIVLSTIDNIVQTASEENIGTPAVIVIGEAVKLHPHFSAIIPHWDAL